MNMSLFILVSFLIFLLFSVPIGFAMLLTSILYVLFSGRVPLTYICQGLVSGISSYTVLAAPFFILTGYIMNGSGITKKIFEFADTAVGHITGGLGHVNVLASAARRK